jgi:hypothetical protein
MSIIVVITKLFNTTKAMAPPNYILNYIMYQIKFQLDKIQYIYIYIINQGFNLTPSIKKLKINLIRNVTSKGNN